MQEEYNNNNKIEENYWKGENFSGPESNIVGYENIQRYDTRNPTTWNLVIVSYLVAIKVIGFRNSKLLRLYKHFDNHSKPYSET